MSAKFYGESVRQVFHFLPHFRFLFAFFSFCFIFALFLLHCEVSFLAKAYFSELIQSKSGLIEK